ncbi:hypothetical protein D8674_022108 [Pyrus ussuriensis x Pyrus communis]|uniref:Uncharacterized protein n=1 Tax=Pyrus ussuriensis x Pyrus communis TaxID=2448454 RepID=A0A5N5GQN6_9ROSA|nr:hypothetical protein D8674_022108 [Pyrus ussuriensis x Pyrus communis]
MKYLIDQKNQNIVVIWKQNITALASLTSSVTLLVSARRAHRHPPKKSTQGPCRQLKTAKVTEVTNGRITIGYDERHQITPMSKQHSALVHDIGHIVRTFCPIRWRSWKVMPEEVKNTVCNHFLQWKNDLHQYFEQFDDLQVILEEGCSKEFEDREDSWVWLCDHFQEPGYMINWEEKTLLHHSGSRPFSYRMDGRWKGSKLLEIDTFADIYPIVPPEYVSLVFLHHRPQSPSTPSIHNNQARRSLTQSPTLPLTNSKITKHLRTTCL